MSVSIASSAKASDEIFTINDFGGVGSYQTPSARMMPDGGVAAGYTSIFPYNRGFASVQFLPFLETTLRYTEIEDRLFGPINDQTDKDRGLDFKLRFMEETRHLPALAVGVRDIGGTGKFSGEYIVGSKRFGDFDLTLGIGWGNLGARGDFTNPLTYISDEFKTRSGVSDLGGTLNAASFFSGEEASLLGSLQWYTPVDGLRVHLELDGNDYSNETASTDIRSEIPFNFGLNYQLEDYLDFSLAYERGSEVMFGITAKFNLNDLQGLPELAKRPSRIATNEYYSGSSIDEATATPDAFGETLRTTLDETGVRLNAWGIEGNTLNLVVNQRRFRYYARAMGRSMRKLHGKLGKDIQAVNFVFDENGLYVNQMNIIREHMVAMDELRATTDDFYLSSSIGEVDPWVVDEMAPNRVAEYPRFSWSVAPKLRQHIGGPDAFYFWQLWLAISGNLQLTDNLAIRSVYGVDVYNNFDDLTFPSDSLLPHVRSDIKDYLKEGENGITRLEVDYIDTLGPGVFGRLSAGIFEDMYGGVAGEVLYWPYDSRFAVGMELGWVQQRAFDKMFEFQDYSVVTGHINAYYDIPWMNTLAKVSVGQYLAEDRGVTLDFSREFDSGMRVGVFATFTDVSAAEFGEGSFDKGLYMSFPLEILRTTPSKGRAALTWKPLTRDGGQKAVMGPSLYGAVYEGRKKSVDEGWDRSFEW